MTQSLTSGIEDRHTMGLPACCGLLVAVMAVAYFPAAYLMYERGGVDGLAACTMAGLICLAPAIAALVVSFKARRIIHPVAALMLGMLLRTGVPLVAAIVLSSLSPSLARGGLLGITVVFFLLALFTETSLLVYLIKAEEAGKDS